MSETQLGNAVRMPVNADEVPVMHAVEDATAIVDWAWAPTIRWPIGADGIPKIAVVNLGSTNVEVPVVEQAVKAVAATAINGHRFVAYESGKLVLADHTHPNVLGLILNAVTADEETEVVTGGLVSNVGWNFVRDRPVLLGTDGRPTQSVTETMRFILPIGIPTSQSAMSIRIGNPIYL